MTHRYFVPPCQIGLSLDGLNRNQCAEEWHDRRIYGHHTLYGPWAGWYTTGDAIVTPEKIRMRREVLRFLIASHIEDGYATHPKRVRNFRRWELSR